MTEHVEVLSSSILLSVYYHTFDIAVASIILKGATPFYIVLSCLVGYGKGVF